VSGRRAAGVDGRGEPYDRAYYDKWYRSRAHRVRTTGELARIVRFVVAATEHVLERPVRRVLDVGAGEGNWYPLLRALRPRVHYLGIDPSAYAVARYGRRRRLVQGSIEALAAAGARGRYDLVVASGMLNYLSEAQLVRGLAAVAAHTGGVAYLELFAAGDAVAGDTAWAPLRPAAWYAARCRGAGLVPIGLHLYVPSDEADRLAQLERPAR
jgi:SAM-dependent methyltransferase